MNDEKLSYREFSMLAILYDQTNIVAFLLENESNIDLEECFFNRYDVTMFLPSGKKIIPSNHYYDLVNKNGAGIKALLLKKQDLEAKSENTSALQVEIELDGLKTFSLIYEGATFKERFIFEWRLIPYWLADKLINNGETVLKAFGCNWWGIIDIANEVSNNKSLQAIWSNLNSNST